MGSEMKFYKIDDQNFVFSVKAGDKGESAIRYYHALIGEDKTCNVRRIRNAFTYLSKLKVCRVAEFSLDYARIVTSLIDYCETDPSLVDYDARREKAIDYSRLLDKMSKDLDSIGHGDDRVLSIVSIRPSKSKADHSDPVFYEIDREDRSFISSGITTNNSVNSFRIK